MTLTPEPPRVGRGDAAEHRLEQPRVEHARRRPARMQTDSIRMPSICRWRASSFRCSWCTAAKVGSSVAERLGLGLAHHVAGERGRLLHRHQVPEREGEPAGDQPDRAEHRARPPRAGREK